MGWRTVVITNPARLRIEASQLIIMQDQEIPIPIEDIGVLMLESPQVTMLSSVIARLADSGALLLVCGEKHVPVMIGMPYAGHCRVSGVQRMQLSVSLPFRKRCWQQIVRSKIMNQAECLAIMRRDGSESISAMVDKVTSGDASNIESIAAREYFRFLFGEDFERGANDTVNAALNYGYAVLRASVVRSLTAHGFLLTHGVHHSSELNPFNLADDFLEPLRPLVDLYTASSLPLPGEFRKEQRAGIVSLLGYEILVDGQKQSALHAAEIMATSFHSACRESDPGLLKLPHLIPLAMHSYE